jgi:hypothetical protein
LTPCREGNHADVRVMLAAYLVVLIVGLVFYAVVGAVGW